MEFESTEGPEQWEMHLCPAQHCDGHQVALGSDS